MGSAAAHWGYAAPGTLCSSRFMWIPGPITTVHYEHNYPKAAVAVRIALDAQRWFTEKDRAGMVVHGNHPFSVGKMQTAISSSHRPGM